MQIFYPKRIGFHFYGSVSYTHLLVAYEDMVEYYSEVSSKINSKEIIVQTINFTYSDNDDDQVEKSDTAFVKYQITPEFKFIAN